MHTRISTAKALLALAFLIGGVGHAKADTLYNTGVDNGGTVLVPPPNQLDTHWKVSSIEASLTNADVYVGNVPGNGIGALGSYITAPSGSAWVSPNPDMISPAGVYTYATNFIAPSTASVTISGTWASDNETRAINLFNVSTNAVVGTFTPTGVPASELAYTVLSPFQVSGGLILGDEYALQFVVYNEPNDGNNPTALLVVFPSDGGFVASPEPATMTLLGLGIAGMAGYGWRRRKQAVAA